MNYLSKVRNTITVFTIGAFIAAFSVNAQTKPASSEAPAKAIDAKQKAEIEAIIREYLLKNPTLLREVAQALQQQEEAQKKQAAAAARKTHDAEIYADPDSPVLGNAKGNVSVVVFFDYFCGYCKKTLPALADLAATDRSVRIIYKEFPILSPQSAAAAKAALAAARQGKYIEFHRALVDSTNASDATLKSISDKLGLDYVILQKDMKDPKLLAALARTRQLAEALNIDGTPSYLVGDRLIPGSIEIENLTELIKEEREKALTRETKLKSQK